MMMMIGKRRAGGRKKKIKNMDQACGIKKYGFDLPVSSQII